MKILIAPVSLALVAQSACAAVSVADAANQFGVDLYGQLRSRPGNLFFSPYSVDTALLMVQAGAAGKTADEMNAVLHLPAGSADDLHQAAGQLITSLQADRADKGFELHVANALWVQKNYSLLPAYTDLLQSRYTASATPADFANAAATAKDINQWVEQKTNDRIKNLISPGDLNASIRLTLVNAIYFKGDWESQFNPSSTHDGPWHLDDGTVLRKPAAMMQQHGSFLFFGDEHVEALQMPYKGKQLAMLVLLPLQGKLADLEAQLTPEWLNRVVAGLHPAEVAVWLPKFTMHDKLPLSQTLQSMGMKDAFTDDADFSKMDGRRDLAISRVIHAAFVQVDETGTEAAGATGITMRTTAVRRTLEFRADHAFLFLIRDVNSGAILFMGRLTDPTAK